MCLFCDIADHSFTGAHIVDETEKTITFLDIAPANEGHVLIIPKMHVDSIVDLPDEYVMDITGVSRRIIKAFGSVYGAKGIGSCKTAGRTVSLVIFTSMCSPGLRTMVMIGFIPSERKKCLRKLLKE